ncbi:hypothetical protein EV651_107271 [Kribbella sp. VKM Ac-2571]|uniref:hypothetical protein n=1 Tax=Kribbella sp. VKM Ac-2571 TaxID=2512222 RepID=UPI001060C5ED|nr:hypothetical protein [Kribbella sp. VKM Ac-2571]TDO60997.1 hypothetical protein EV651_107271 [Kribbella sp. VKM Ac-2571]
MQRDNVALWSFIGLVAFGLAAVIAANRRRGGSWVNPSTTDGPLWVPAAPAAVLLAMSTPLVIWAAFTTMYDLAYSDPWFDAPGFLLQPIPGLLVGIAALRCAHAVRQESRDRPSGRTLALSTTILAYAAAVLALLAALVSFAAMLGQGG